VNEAFIAPTLTERRDGFDYGYWMNCACGGVSYLSPADYIAEADAAHITCEHCGERIHFGPAVAAIRDRDDPALHNDGVVSLAWYHTSTSADWPSPDFATRFVQGLSWVGRDLGLSREAFISDQISKALHVGTYEAAIENMVRRMHDQDDGSAQFYLYRVALRLDSRRINAGYRDENHEIAADISVSDLDRAGLDAVRYLNVHEAIGVLSLAVRPDAIAAVQGIPVPLEGLEMVLAPGSFQAEMDAVSDAIRELANAEAAATSIDPRERRMMQFGIRPDPSGLAKRVGDLELRFYDSWHRLETSMGEGYLPKASVVVRRDFNDAMEHWRAENQTASVDGFVERYRAMSALFERSADVIEGVAGQPWRLVGS
jgi:hypothetical protein